VAALVGLALGEGVSADDAVALYRGLRACGDAFGCPVVGGDVSRAGELVLAVSVIGRAAEPLLRSGARPGDALAVTGALGGSEAGRLLLEGLHCPAAPAAALAARHRRPQPRLAEGRALARAAHAMLDVSDGIANDARRLAAASDVAITVDLDSLPLDPGVREVAAATGVEAGVLGATGGEDYELLVAVDPAVLAAPPVPLTLIGEVAAGPAAVTFRGAGAHDAIAGWDHLRSRPR
jgi:thiamine-monophosphate kinase